MNEPGTIKITVLDEPFRIASSAEPEYTREVAAYVDRTLRSLRDSAPTLEPFKIAVLGAMEITDELLQARSERGSLEAKVVGIEGRVTEALKRDAARKDGKAKRQRKETSGRSS